MRPQLRLSDIELLRVIDCDFALHASNSLRHRSRLRRDWRLLRLRGSLRHPAGLRPGIAAPAPPRGRSSAAGPSAYATPRQRRLEAPSGVHLPVTKQDNVVHAVYVSENRGLFPKATRKP